MLRIAAFGDNVVDCYLSMGQMYPGGNCLNVSIFLSRFGAQSAYIGAVGKDKAGEVIDLCAEMTRLPGHCAPRLMPENATAQTTPSRSTMVPHI